MYITNKGDSVNKLLFSIDIGFIMEKYRYHIDSLKIQLYDRNIISYNPSFEDMVSYGLTIIISDLSIYNKLFLETLKLVDYGIDMFPDMNPQNLDLPVVRQLFQQVNSFFKEVGLYLAHMLMSLNVPTSSFFSLQRFNGSTIFLVAQSNEVEFYDKL